MMTQLIHFCQRAEELFQRPPNRILYLHVPNEDGVYTKTAVPHSAVPFITIVGNHDHEPGDISAISFLQHNVVSCTVINLTSFISLTDDDTFTLRPLVVTVEIDGTPETGALALYGIGYMDHDLLNARLAHGMLTFAEPPQPLLPACDIIPIQLIHQNLRPTGSGMHDYVTLSLFPEFIRLFVAGHIHDPCLRPTPVQGSRAPPGRSQHYLRPGSTVAVRARSTERSQR